jgi:hypothetical protein
MIEFLVENHRSAEISRRMIPFERASSFGIGGPAGAKNPMSPFIYDGKLAWA